MSGISYCAVDLNEEKINSMEILPVDINDIAVGIRCDCSL